MPTPEKMQAPKGITAATIAGHEYEVPKSGIVKVVNQDHVDILRRHGFVDHFEEEADLDAKIDSIDDKDELVEFIETRGGEADNTMGMKKLRRIARETLNPTDED